jgi:hypothetical protein
MIFDHNRPDGLGHAWIFHPLEQYANTSIVIVGALRFVLF